MRDCFPKHAWNEWMFARVPASFWDSLANRKRYIRWLGEKLKFKRPQDWYNVTYSDFAMHCGSGLVARYRSHMKVVKECVPGFK